MSDDISRTTIYSVQAARGISAAMVVVYHSASMFALPKYGGIDLWSGWGDLGKHGVDFFFVLSGFIIFHAHRSDIGHPEAAPRYAWKRAVRVYPIYWFYLAVFLALNLLGGGFKFSDAGSEIASAVSLLRFSSERPPLQVAWTLFHEVAFYALFAALIFSKRLGIAVFSAWLVLILAMHRLVATNNPTEFTVIYDVFDLDFLFGIAVAFLNRPLNLAVGAPLATLGIMLFVTTFTAQHSWGVTEEVSAVGYGLCSAIILFAIVGCEKAGNLNVGSILKRMGDATFTIYLSHPILLSVFLKAGSHTARKSMLASNLYVVGMALIAILVGYALYRAIERPALRLLRNPRRWTGISMRGYGDRRLR